MLHVVSGNQGTERRFAVVESRRPSDRRLGVQAEICIDERTAPLLQHRMSFNEEKYISRGSLVPRLIKAYLARHIIDLHICVNDDIAASGQGTHLFRVLFGSVPYSRDGNHLILVSGKVLAQCRLQRPPTDVTS